MSTKLFNGRLVSSKLKKYDHKTEQYILVEDPEQAHRLGEVSVISYTSDKGEVSKLHNLEGPALQTGKDKDYYLHGIKYSKDSWTSLKELGKVDNYIDKSLY
jgi:hypothetical protein